MDRDAPSVIVLAGPNGVGKSTIATRLLAGALGVYHFVNADTLARGLSAFHFDDMAMKAGRIMLEHLKDLARARASFAFETTLASRTFAPLISQWKKRATGSTFSSCGCHRRRFVCCGLASECARAVMAFLNMSSFAAISAVLRTSSIS